MDNFKFNEKEHAYYDGERRLPSVTDIVGNVCGVEHYADEWYMNRGSMVHRAVALYLQGKLDEKSVDARIRSRVESAKKAIRELSIRPPYLIEKKLHHFVLQYAGTPDLLSGRDLIDWKSSHVPETEIKTGGYVELLENNGYPVKNCFEIVLDDDKYALFEYRPKRSRGLFLAALSLYNWRHNV